MGGRDTAICPPALAGYLASLEKRFEPKSVILFGSQARGDATQRSDYDLLVVADTLPRDFWERTKVLWEEKPPLVDVLGFTEAELLACLHRGLTLDALLDGRPLVGSMKTWQRRARRHLRENDLVRTHFGYVRRFRGLPGQA
jgi:predicted nucleotidyltransferase